LLAHSVPVACGRLTQQSAGLRLGHNSQSPISSSEAPLRFDPRTPLIYPVRLDFRLNGPVAGDRANSTVKYIRLCHSRLRSGAVSVFLGCCFSYRNLRRGCPTILEIAAEGPCSAASALCPVRVARVSRLIGNSDTTANRSGWQVSIFPEVPVAAIPKCFARLRCNRQQMQKRHSIGVASAVLRWSLASQLMCGRWSCPPCLPQNPPAGFPFFQGRFLADALAGSLPFSGAGRKSLQQPDHHWHPLHSNPIAVLKSFYFQSLARPPKPRRSRFW